MIFVSFQSASEQFAIDLRKRLTLERNLTVWMFTSDLRGGHEWHKVIDNAIDDCSMMIVLVTSEAIESKYVIYEWSRALGQNKRVIPLIIEPLNPEIMHPRMRVLQYRNAVAPTFSWEGFLDEVAEVDNMVATPPLVVSATMAIYNSDKATQNSGISVLLHYDHPSATKALADAVKIPLPDLSIRAALALARKTNYQDDLAIDGFIHAMSKEWFDGDLWSKVLQSLKRINTDKAVYCLAVGIRSLEQHRQRSIVTMLVQMELVSSSEVLLEYSENFEQRMDILEALTARRYSPATPFFASVLHEHVRAGYNASIEYQIKLIGALEAIGGTEAIDALHQTMEMLANGAFVHNSDVFDAAMEAAIRIHDKSTYTFFLEALKDNRYRRVHHILERETSNWPQRN